MTPKDNQNNFTPEYEAVSQKVIEWARETLEESDCCEKKDLNRRLAKISPRTKCEEIVWDSLDLVEAILELEAKFDINVIEEISLKATLEDISDRIADIKHITKYKPMPQPVAKKTLLNKVKDFFSKTRQ